MLTTSNQNKTKTKTISSKQDKAPELLHLTGELRRRRLFLLTEINDLREATDKREEKNATATITPAEFSYLQKLCLVKIITFNAERGGEASKIKLEQWMNSEKWKRHEDINSIEDPVESLLAQRLKLTYSKGK